MTDLTIDASLSASLATSPQGAVRLPDWGLIRARGADARAFLQGQLTGNTGANIDAAKAVGKLLAERAVKNGVKEVVFDRGGYLYHGRVKALADAARESGLSF